MNISIIGSGYVGLVAAACFSEMGNKVVCVDIDEQKVAQLQKGIIPIYEPALKPLVQENYNKGSLLFSAKIEDALENSEVVFIAVGTPMGEDGSADLQYVLQVAKEIGEQMTDSLIVVNKSTVPVGTADKVRVEIEKALNKRELQIDFDVVSNPEFLKEGSAVDDFMRPDRVVVGADNEKSLQKMKQLYAPFTFNHDRFIGMDIRSAEMTKYAANAMLATKISFINEMANICERVGADVNNVRVGIGSDKRIGYQFIYAGCGYGGSCFPKDVKALVSIANDHDYHPALIAAVESVNDAQKKVLGAKAVESFGEDFSGKTFAIWGLSFKPGTDDMRAASSIDLIKEIVERGGKVQAYDPKAIPEAKFYLKEVEVQYFQDKYEVLKDADAVVLVTEWKEFRSPNFNKVLKLMNGNIFIDGRNQYDKNMMNDLGFDYLQIGVK
jgi:UDPglucose 6-dehydrogenase